MKSIPKISRQPACDVGNGCMNLTTLVVISFICFSIWSTYALPMQLINYLFAFENYKYYY